MFTLEVHNPAHPPTIYKAILMIKGDMVSYRILPNGNHQEMVVFF